MLHDLAHVRVCLLFVGHLPGEKKRLLCVFVDHLLPFVPNAHVAIAKRNYFYKQTRLSEAKSWSRWLPHQCKALNISKPFDNVARHVFSQDSFADDTFARNCSGVI